MAYKKRTYSSEICAYCGSNNAHGYYKTRPECESCNKNRRKPRLSKINEEMKGGRRKIKKLFYN